MKRRIKGLRLLLSGAALAFAMLGLSGVAHATAYTSCASVPPSVGDADITDTACVFANDVTATGHITVTATSVNGSKRLKGTDVNIQATGGAVNLATINSTAGNVTITSSGSSSDINIGSTVAAINGYVHINSGGLFSAGGISTSGTTGGDTTISANGKITTTSLAGATYLDVTSTGANSDITITSATALNGYVYINSGGLIGASNNIQSSANGHVLLFAQQSISAALITALGNGFNIDIKAYLGGSPTPFVVGAGSVPTNGTSGTIKSGITGGGAIYITNGTPGSAGDIKITTANNLVVNSSATKPGYLILNANDGKLSLPTGPTRVLASNGPGGTIILMANTVAIDPSAAASLEAASSLTQGSLHGISISAKTVTYGTLTIDASGNGSAPNGAYIYLFTEGATTISDNQSKTGSNINGTSNPNIQGMISYQGSGALTAKVNGDNAFLDVSAYPISFSGGPVTLQSTGKTNHGINIVNPGTLNGSSGLTIGGAGAVTVDASGNRGDGGFIYVNVDAAVFNNSVYSVKANGPGSGNGNGGTILLDTSTLSFNSSATMSLAANAASNGTGDASTTAIRLLPGHSSVAIGKDPGQISFSATGGKMGGNGGTVQVTPFPGSISVSAASTNPINVSAVGPSGNGGNVSLIANPFGTGSVTFTGGGQAINADGGTTSGNGGHLVVLGIGTVSFTRSAPVLSARAPGTSNTNSNSGGSIEIGNTTNLTVNGPSLAVDVGGNATGGTLYLHDLGQLTVTGTLKADGKGTGIAGSVTLSSSAFNLMMLDNATISASGDSNGTGDGNQITISNAGKISLNGTTINAQGGFSGTGGDGGDITINVTGTSTAPLDISQSHINANALVGTSADGGLVNINKVAGPAVGTLIDVDKFIDVAAGSQASTSAFGGQIALNGVDCIRVISPTNYSPWPTFYWQCSNPNNPTLDAVPVALGNSNIGNLKSQLSFKNVQIFVFSDLSDFNTFFAGSVSLDIAGATFQVTANNAIYSTLIEETGSGTALSVVNVQEGSAHEFGHATEFTYGIANQSGLALYDTFAQTDFLNLDYSTWTVSAPGILRDPCLPYTNGMGQLIPAPFVGVTDDSTNNPFCSGGVLEPGMYRNANGSYWTNSKIIQAAAPKIMLKNNGAWRDLYAQTFAFRAFVFSLSPTQYFQQTPDGVFNDGHDFECTLGWALDVLDLVDPTQNPGACSNAIPTWYQVGQ